MSDFFRHATNVLLVLFGFASLNASAQQLAEAPTLKAKQIWQLLDYIAADYGGAVKNSVVVNQGEYDEMVEFAQTAERQLRELPEHGAKAELLGAAKLLRVDITARRESQQVQSHARKLAADLLAAYPVPSAPIKPPRVEDASQGFRALCAQCHGSAGDGKGPLAKTLDPPPIAFTERERARERSVFALYQAISAGVAGTAMPAFGSLHEDEKWALAFYVSGLAFTDAEVKAGETAWTGTGPLKKLVPDLQALSTMEESTLAAKIGGKAAAETLAYLRRNPTALASSPLQSINRAQSRLKESLAAFQAGDLASATRIALSAYLDEFEAVEPALAARNRPLLVRIEKHMAGYRTAISRNDAEQVKASYAGLQEALEQAGDALGELSDDKVAVFLAALTVLLREGIEALLVVVAIVAFLQKAGRQDALPYVHGGWIVALVAGAGTWYAATRVIQFSGASRELVEGVSALLAAAVLIVVGVWMHQKSLAGQWQTYVKQRLSSALGKGSGRMLFLLAFITVYREVFETILFYSAMWRPDAAAPVLAGFFTALAILVLVAVFLLRTSARLPIGQFFQFSSLLVAMLSVVILGKGIAALQEAGYLDMTPLALPRIDLLGIYPSMESLLGQAIGLALIIVGLSFNLLSARRNRRAVD